MAPVSIRLFTWNVLADCYAPVSTPPLLWEARRGLIQESFERLSPGTDLCLLQEVDHFADFYKPMLSSLGLESCYLQRPGRKDGLVVGYRADKLTLEDTEDVFFDDLAMTTREGRPPKRDPVYERQNVGMICRFRFKNDPAKEFLATNCHLYWNPQRAEVKLAQARYLLERIQRSNQGKDLPVVMSGDYNALPNSDVYHLITDPAGGAKSLDPDGEKKFLVDFNLSKLARWMRVLGIDCVLESKESNVLRTGKQGDFTMLFAQARTEKRIILTSSRSMRERASCPQSMLVKTVQLENELSRICREFEIKICEKRFLTVCGKCGGGIESVLVDDPRLAGKFVPLDRPVFCCSSCLQPYWWNEKENSSPARAMRVAERLLKVVRGDDSWRGEGSKLVSSEGEDCGKAERGSGEEEEAETAIGEVEGGDRALADRFAQRSATIAELAVKRRTRVETERDGVGTGVETERDGAGTGVETTPLRGGLNSAVSLHRGKEALFTNWNGAFRGTLDYIFISKGINVIEATIEPTVIDSSSDSLFPPDCDPPPAGSAEALDLSDHGPLPNCRWPSDHLAVVSTLEFD